MRSMKVFLSLSGVLAVLVSLAAKVPEQEAATLARNFFYERISQYRSVTYDEIKPGTAIAVDHEGLTVYYAFNMSPDGFIIVSARDEAYPVLAYSFTGSYDASWQPENFSAWMEQYSRQIHYAATRQIAPSRHAEETWDYYLYTPSRQLTPLSGREVEPLLTSTWNQGKFYNQMCPEDPAGPGGHCYAGCVATAMGQVMNYFRWPDTGTGSYSYECPPYGTLSANFDSTTYRWDLMETSLLHSNLYLAELLYHLGVSVDMVYGPDGSGMYNHKAAYSLKTYFKYSPETQYVYRDSTSMDWDSLLVSHLDRGIPMYYAGWSVPNIYGHAFVCDGYQDSAYYHFNWGWGGSFDGYFYTDNLTPGGSNFNLAQELIINAVPDTATYSYPAYCSGAQEFFALYGTIGDGSGPLYASQPLSDCQWLVAPADSVDGLSLQFLRFSLGQGDTLKVFEGDTITAPLLAAYAAGDEPGTVETSGNTLLVTYHTDDTVSSEGFLAEFSSDLPIYCSGNTMLSGQTDTLTDGSGPWDYQNNTQCMWMISPEGASELTLHFLDFETEENYDFLRIYDLATQELLAEYSGSYAPGLPEPVTSPSGTMFIVFMTNYTQREPGWTAYYMTDLVGVAEPVAYRAIKVFPNPSAGNFMIGMDGSFEGYPILWVHDIYGRTVATFELKGNSANQEIYLNHLAPGLYYLTLSGKDTMRLTKKIIIQ